MTEMRAQLVVDADGTQLVLAGRQGKVAIQDLTDAAAGLTRQTKSASDSASVFQRETREARAAVDQLRAAHDPLFAATRRLEAGEETLARAMRAGSIQAQERDRIMGLLRAEYAATEASVGRMGRGFAGASGGVRQLGLQLNQVAQVGGMTGNWLQALAVQLPDIGLAFGSVGIAAGIAAGVLLPFVSNLGRAADEAEALATQVDALTGAMDALNEATDRASTPFLELIEIAGVAAPRMQELYEKQRLLAFGDAARELSKTTSAITELFGVLEFSDRYVPDVADELERVYDAVNGINPLAVQAIADELGIAAVDAQLLAEQLAALQDAQGAGEWADALTNVREQFEKAAGGVTRMAGETAEVYRQIVLAEAAATELSNVDIAAAFRDGADEAARLIDTLPSGRAGSYQGGRATAYTEGELALLRMGGERIPRDDGRRRRTGASGADREHERAVRSIRRELERLSDSYAEDVEAAERWRDETLAALDPAKAGFEGYAEDVERIFGERLADAYEADLRRRDDWAAGTIRALDDIEDGLQSWADTSEALVTGWSEGLEDAFVDMATTGKASVADLVDFTLEQFLRLAFQQAVQPAIGGVFGGISDAIGGIFGGASGAPTSHTGSIVGTTTVRQSHGRLAGDEQLTVTRLGQRVFTPEQIQNGAAVVDALAMAARQPAQTTVLAPKVEVHNHTTAEVRTRQTEDGGVAIDILGQIERDMAGRVQSGRGPLAQSIGSAFGIKRRFNGGRG